MSPRKATAAQHVADANGYTVEMEHTSERIRAYLAMVRPPRDSDLSDEVDERYHRGRSAIERMALSATGMNDPTLRLSLTDCADALVFINYSEPVDERTWRKEPNDAPSHLAGEYLVLRALEASVRKRS